MRREWLDKLSAEIAVQLQEAQRKAQIVEEEVKDDDDMREYREVLTQRSQLVRAILSDFKVQEEDEQAGSSEADDAKLQDWPARAGL
eukprot:3337445-Lingulodinium_polyedra.AAC.1